MSIKNPHKGVQKGAKFATLFSGGELFGIGARQAGLEHSFGVEIDPKICAVAKDNGFNVHNADILCFKPTVPKDLFLLHASPPCQRASNAHPGSKEIELDIKLARATIRMIKQLKPKFFTLENVIAYKRFAAFALICEYLQSYGYSFAIWHIHMPDFGVPQTRRRLILVARRDGGHIQRISSTHQKSSKPTLFQLPTWLSWYETLKNNNELINLKPCELTKRQRARVESHPAYSMGVPFLVDMRNGGSRKFTYRLASQPSYTITATASKGHGKIFYRGNWYRMSQRAYALIQTVPDSYKLTGNKRVNQMIIGNGIPPLFARRLCEHLTRRMPDVH